MLYMLGKSQFGGVKRWEVWRSQEMGSLVNLQPLKVGPYNSVRHNLCWSSLNPGRSFLTNGLGTGLCVKEKKPGLLPLRTGKKKILDTRLEQQLCKETCTVYISSKAFQMSIKCLLLWLFKVIFY